MKYSEIKDLDGIAAARAEIAAGLSAKEKELVSKYEAAREFYTPSGIFSQGIKNISRIFPFDRILLLLIQILKRKLR